MERDRLRRGGEAGRAAEGAQRERQARGVLGLDQHALVVLAEGARLALAEVALHNVVLLGALQQSHAPDQDVPTKIENSSDACCTCSIIVCGCFLECPSRV